MCIYIYTNIYIYIYICIYMDEYVYTCIRMYDMFMGITLCVYILL